MAQKMHEQKDIENLEMGKQRIVYRVEKVLSRVVVHSWGFVELVKTG